MHPDNYRTLSAIDVRTLKDDKYNAILEAARHEFVEKGFKDASMRSISKKSEVGLSNIYNYFENKDEIFLAVVNPAKEELYRFITLQHSEETFDFNRKSVFGVQEEAMEYYIELLFKYKEEFRLLLFHSQASSVGNFRDKLADHMTKVSYTYMEIEKKHYPEVNPISSFFIHSMSVWMISLLGEIVNHNMSRQEIRDFFREYFRFGYAGWRELTGV